MNIGTKHQIQQKGFHNKTFNLYETLQDAVEKEAGVRCSIIVTPKVVSVRAKDFADYCLAKAVIKQRVKQEVVRDVK